MCDPLFKAPARSIPARRKGSRRDALFVIEIATDGLGRIGIAHSDGFADVLARHHQL